MTRRTLVLLLLALSTLSAACAMAARPGNEVATPTMAIEETMDIDDLVAQLSGRTAMSETVSQDVAAAYRQVIAGLTPGIAAADPVAREAPQKDFHAICMHASRPGAESERRALCDVLGGHLLEDAPEEAHAWFLRQVALIGREESVATLAKTLAGHNSRLSELSRRALERNPDPSAGRVLVAALRKSSKPEWRVALINALAARRDAFALPEILKLARFSAAAPASVRTASIAALGDLGGDDARDALFELWKSDSDPARGDIANALLRMADRLRDRERTEDARTIYTRLLAANGRGTHGFAALRGIADCGGDAAVGPIADAFDEGEATRRRMAIRLAGSVSGGKMTDALIAKLSNATVPEQALLLDVLAGRPGDKVRNAILGGLESAEPDVRHAALRALGQRPDGDNALIIVLHGAMNPGTDRKVARETTARMSGKHIDGIFLGAVAATEDSAACVELIHALSVRRHEPAVATLERTVADDRPKVRAACFDALAEFRRESSLAPVIDALLRETDGGARSRAEACIVTITARLEDPESVTRDLLAPRFESATGATRASLLGIMGSVKGPAALSHVRKAVGDDDPAVVEGAVRALAGWEDPIVYPDLLAVATSSDHPLHKVLALRGAVDCLRRPSEQTDAEKFAKLEKLLGLAERDEEKKLVLGALAGVRDVNALVLAQGFMGSNLENEAAGATTAIARMLLAEHEAVAASALRSVMSAAVAESTKTDARRALELLDQHRTFIGTWLSSPSYSREGYRGGRLFDTELAPEVDAAAVTWRPLSTKGQNNPWIFDLKQLAPGDHQVAYARCTIDAPSTMEALLLIGSDDGVKAWLNDELVHSNKVRRGLTPREDAVPVTLRQGANRLVLKISQVNGDWRFCCAVETPDKKPIEGIRFRGE